MVPYQLTAAVDYLNLVIFIFVNAHQLQSLLSHDKPNCLISAFSPESGTFLYARLWCYKLIISGIRIFVLFY